MSVTSLGVGIRRYFGWCGVFFVAMIGCAARDRRPQAPHERTACLSRAEEIHSALLRQCERHGWECQYLGRLATERHGLEPVYYPGVWEVRRATAEQSVSTLQNEGGVLLRFGITRSDLTPIRDETLSRISGHTVYVGVFPSERLPESSMTASELLARVLSSDQ